MSPPKKPASSAASIKASDPGVGPARKLTLGKDTLKDLTPPTRSVQQVKGGVKTVGCTPTLSPS